jgi:hypothetical protein
VKALFSVGLVILILGVLSFFVPIPRSERHGIKAGDVNIGVQTEHNEYLPRALSITLLVVGGGMMVAGGRRSAA